MKLGEENRRRRLLGPPSQTPPPSALAMPSGYESDSEGSIVRTPSKAHASCGACRTRDTKLWWKAPKGLATSVLCDACGISWRKYADLNHLRPIREEAAAVKQAKSEKREGTPLAGSNVKRVKVSIVVY
jgi:Zn ribbon nucleic-acid-binding protein